MGAAMCRVWVGKGARSLTMASTWSTTSDGGILLYVSSNSQVSSGIVGGPGTYHGTSF